MSNDETLGETKKSRALALFREGKTVAEVMAALDVSRTTLWRWRDEPVFALALEELQVRSIREANRKLADLAPIAVDVVTRILTDPHANARIRFRAAEMLIGRLKLDGALPVAPEGSRRTQTREEMIASLRVALEHLEHTRSEDNRLEGSSDSVRRLP